MADFLLTSAVIFLVLSGWLSVQALYRRFAARHPELGPFRGEGGCGGGCSCSQGSCTPTRPAGDTTTVVSVDVRLAVGRRGNDHGSDGK